MAFCWWVFQVIVSFAGPRFLPICVARNILFLYYAQPQSPGPYSASLPRILEILLSKERVLTLLYEKAFPYKHDLHQKERDAVCDLRALQAALVREEDTGCPGPPNLFSRALSIAHLRTCETEEISS